MAIANTAHGNTKTSSTAATTSGAITTTAAIGETIVVAVGTVNTTSNAPTDTASNTYVQLGAIATNTERITFWGCLSSLGASPSVTCTFGSSRYGIAIATYTGVKSFKQSNTTTNTGSASPATATLPNALDSGNWALAAFADKGTVTWSASTGNLRNHVSGAGTTTPGVAIVDNTTTTCAAAQSTSAVWAGTIIELSSTFAQAISAIGSSLNGGVAKQSQIPLSGLSSSFNADALKQIQIKISALSTALNGIVLAGVVFLQNVTGIATALSGKIIKQTSRNLIATSASFLGTIFKNIKINLNSASNSLSGLINKTVPIVLRAVSMAFSGIQVIVFHASAGLNAASSAFSAAFSAALTGGQTFFVNLAATMASLFGYYEGNSVTPPVYIPSVLTNWPIENIKIMLKANPTTQLWPINIYPDFPNGIPRSAFQYELDNRPAPASAIGQHDDYISGYNEYINTHD